MNQKLKRQIFKSLEKISLEQENIEELDVKFQNILDISNLVKLIDGYEEFEPEIRDMLNKKARKDKWKGKEK